VDPRLVAGLLIVGMALLGFVIGRSTRDSGDSGGARPAAALSAEELAKARLAADRRGYAAGVASGRTAGKTAGRRAGEKRGRRELARRGAQQAPATGGQPTDQAGNPAPNPNCPAGQEPVAGGGCAPYNEQNGQVEPRINNPDCYKPNPPAGCF
jgi:hypothetical protein